MPFDINNTGMLRQREVEAALNIHPNFSCYSARGDVEDIARLTNVNVNLLERHWGDLVILPKQSTYKGLINLGLTVEVCSSEKYQNGSIGIEKERDCKADIVAFNQPMTDSDARWICFIFMEQLRPVLSCINPRSSYDDREFKVLPAEYLARHTIFADTLLQLLDEGLYPMRPL